MDVKGGAYVAAIHMVNLQIFFNGEREEMEEGKGYEKLKGTFRHSYESTSVLHREISELSYIMKVFI